MPRVSLGGPTKPRHEHPVQQLRLPPVFRAACPVLQGRGTLRERQERPPGPACHRPDPPGPGTGPRSAVPVLPPMRRRRPSRTAAPSHNRRDMVARDPCVPAPGITNAGSEGTNRVIKTTSREAYGSRNPGNQRLRTRCATTRRARGHLDAR
ncbi:transposase [Streptomyces mirabilis]|uniref:transposase n=1 Tax=Streptomyces mirabilis TaxID=68239 RepID=UPI003645B19A